MLGRMQRVLRIGLCAFVFACGGAVTNPIDDGGTDGGKGQDSSPDVITPGDASSPIGCPASPPLSGAACSPDQIECEYGSNPSPDCNQLFRCNAGHWQEDSTGTICAPQSDCPATYADVPQNGTCSPQGLGCAYPEGTCFCGNSLLTQNPSWTCNAGTSTCPSPRPDIGTPCNEPGQQCDYASCSGGVALQCTGGMWTQVFTPCPG